MKVDETTAKIIDDIQEEINNKYNINLNTDKIIEIIDFQYHGLLLAVSKGMDIKLPKLGSFLHTNKNGRRAERLKVTKLINENKKLNPEFNSEEIKKVFVKDWAIRTEIAKLEKQQINKVNTTAIELLEKDTIKCSNSVIFKKLGNIIKKDNNEF